MFNKKGFTLIELLVAATIMILLTTIGLVSYQNANRNARNAKRKADLATVQQSLVLYRSTEGTYPDGAGGAAAFTAMVTEISDYLSNASSIEDPKNSAPYVYTYTSDGTEFELGATLELPDGSTQAYTVDNP